MFDTKDAIDTLCNSCTNKTCMFQSGIQRSKCDFYIPPMPHLEPDNCGNYVVQQEPSGDAISRREVLEVLDKSKYSNKFCVEHNIDWSINLGMAHIVVNELKPVAPMQKTGYWIVEGAVDCYLEKVR